MNTRAPTPAIPIRLSPAARTTEQLEALLASKPKFGEVFTDHMVVAQYTPEKRWHDFAVTAVAPFEMHPGSSVLHYGQAIFEGLKAYRQPDGGVALFRPDMNAHRFVASATRMFPERGDMLGRR